MYWRNTCIPSLPTVKHRGPRSDTKDLPILLSQIQVSKVPSGYVDSTWGTDISHRLPVTGHGYQLAGALITYKTRFQRSMALSSTEAEYVTATDAEKNCTLRLFNST